MCRTQRKSLQNVNDGLEVRLFERCVGPLAEIDGSNTELGMADGDCGTCTSLNRECSDGPAQDAEMRGSW
jgi:hypothetical protein